MTIKPVASSQKGKDELSDDPNQNLVGERGTNVSTMLRLEIICCRWFQYGPAMVAILGFPFCVYSFVVHTQWWWCQCSRIVIIKKCFLQSPKREKRKNTVFEDRHRRPPQKRWDKGARNVWTTIMCSSSRSSRWKERNVGTLLSFAQIIWYKPVVAAR